MLLFLTTTLVGGASMDTSKDLGRLCPPRQGASGEFFRSLCSSRSPQRRDDARRALMIMKHHEIPDEAFCSICVDENNNIHSSCAAVLSHYSSAHVDDDDVDKDLERWCAGHRAQRSKRPILAVVLALLAFLIILTSLFARTNYMPKEGDDFLESFEAQTRPLSIARMPKTELTRQISLSCTR